MWNGLSVGRADGEGDLFAVTEKVPVVDHLGLGKHELPAAGDDDQASWDGVGGAAVILLHKPAHGAAIGRDLERVDGGLTGFLCDRSVAAIPLHMGEAVGTDECPRYSGWLGKRGADREERKSDCADGDQEYPHMVEGTPWDRARRSFAGLVS